MMKSLRSIKSGRSVRSIKSVDFDQNQLEFEKLLVDACQKFTCPHSVVVNKDTQDNFSVTTKPSRTSGEYKKNGTRMNLACQEPAPEATNDIDENTVVVKATYSNVNKLAEVAINNSKYVPRIVIQLIGVLAPLYRQLTKISIKRSHIDKYTVYELSKMLSKSMVTEICLDGSALPEANYAMLLDSPILRNLSLSSCNINDYVCKQIFEKLHFLKNSEATLAVLNLSSNQITDVGAKHAATALRTNRHLRYLNLADNRITDEGSAYIFAVLSDFPLTDDEVSELRKRHLENLKIKRALITKYLNEFKSKSTEEANSASKKVSKNPKPAKHNPPNKKEKMPLHDHHNEKLPNNERVKHHDQQDDLTAKAEQIVNELIGPIEDPFSADDITTKDGNIICKGNFALSYLNLSYNQLTYPSLKIILKTVQYQQSIKTKPEHGLLKILVDGNSMPINCSEIATVNEILNDNMAAFGGRSLIDRTAKLTKKRVSVSNKSILPSPQAV